MEAWSQACLEALKASVYGGVASGFSRLYRKCLWRGFPKDFAAPISGAVTLGVTKQVAAIGLY
jgi:hypothetical protein